MERLSIAGLLVLALASAVVGQAAPLQVEGANSSFGAWLTETTRDLAGTLADPRASTRGDVSPLEDAHTVLGLLRLGDDAGARKVLDRCSEATMHGPGSPPCADRAIWSTIANYWYLRATQDTFAAGRQHVALCDAMAAADSALPKEPATFVERALHVHALFCLGGILDTLERIERGEGPPHDAPDQRPGARWTRRAVDRCIELECESWQPGRGHFRPRLTRGSLALPEPSDPSVLVPAAAGMLIATGDRTLRHLRSVLDRGWATDAPLPAWAAPFGSRATSLCLAAAAQLGDVATLERVWPLLLAEDAPDTGGGPGLAGCRLDAALFAVSGLRVATGAGVDENWLRLRPWLPPGHDHLALRRMRADGVQFDLEMTARHGAARPDEFQEQLEAGAIAGDRIRVRVLLRASPASRARAVIVQAPHSQYVTHLRPGDVWERSLAR